MSIFNKSKTEQTDYDRQQIINANIALIISIISILFSFFTFVWNEHKDMKTNQEVLTIRVTPIAFDYDTEYKKMGNSGVITTIYKCIVTNNGEKGLSLINYHIELIDNKDSIKYYSGLDQGLYTDYSELFLPLNLEPSESTSFYIKVGELMDSKSLSLLEEEYSEGTPYKYRDLVFYLAEENTDFYGNIIDPMIESGDVVGFSIETDSNFPTYRLNLTTAKDNKFNSTFNSNDIHFNYF